MNIAGLDLNASRALAVAGPPGAPAPLPLCENGELIAAIALEGRHPEVGRAGAAICRRFPHLACLDFLAELGTGRTWSAGRHRLDPVRACELFFERLRPAFGDVTSLALALPAYLSRTQTEALAGLARRLRVPLAATLPAPLAAASATGDRSGPAIVVEADWHALSAARVEFRPGHVQLTGRQAFPALGTAAWKEAALDAICELCVRQSRRDPRDSGEAEQLLFDQLDDVFAAGEDGEMVEVVARASHWCQNLILRPEQTLGFVSGLAREAAEAVLAAFPETGHTILVSAEADRLPGFTALLREGSAAVAVLPANAAAAGAHRLAALGSANGTVRHVESVFEFTAQTPAEAPAPRRAFLRLSGRGH